MYWYITIELKIYASQIISEILMAEYIGLYIVILGYMKNYLKLLLVTKIVYLLISLQI